MGVLIVLLLFALPAFAGDIFVDRDVTCPGSGTTGSPYCSIQNAFNVVNAGDHIKIRDSSNSYNEAPLLTRSGSSGNPIIIEPDSGHNPNIIGTNGNPGAGMRIQASYVTIQNLRFDGAGAYSRWGVVIDTNGANITNITVNGCTISNQGGSESQADDSTNEGGVLVRNAFGTNFVPSNVTVSNNTMDSNRGYGGVFFSGTGAGTFTGNTVSNVKRGRFGTTGEGIIEIGVKLASDGTATQAPAKQSGPFTITNNVFHDFQSVSSWTVTASSLSAVGANLLGIYGDTSARPATVTGNTIYKIDETATTNSPCNSGGGTLAKCQYVNVYGITPESQCHNWLIQGNLVYRIGKEGITVGSGPRNADNVQVLNNTVFSTGFAGISVRNGANTILKNNIAYVNTTGARALYYLDGTVLDNGAHTINYNNWYNSASSNVASIAGSSYTFSSWKTELNTNHSNVVGKDANSINPDPLFTSITSNSENFVLQATSPAIATGQNGINMGWDTTTSGGGTPPGVISNLNPVGTNRWLIGESRSFIWTNTGTVGNVDILQSFDSGATFPITIASNVVNTSSYNWTVVGPVSSTVRFKVQDHGTPSINDSTDSDIRIGGSRAILSAH